MSTAKRFQLNLQEILRRKQISQSEAARLMGVSSSYINQLVKGKQTPGLDVLDRLADALSVEVQELLFENSENAA